jgi:hypothetical protein
VNIVFVAPKSAWRQALAAETRAAADDGHRVCVIAEENPDWESNPIDGRVEVRWTGASELSAPEPLFVNVFLRRLPLGLLRRIGRGPLRGPADRLTRAWRRRVLGRLKKRRWPLTDRMRTARRIDSVREALADWQPDWIVLHEPQAIELGVHYLPEILDARTDLVTTFSYEPRAEASPAHA